MDKYIERNRSPKARSNSLGSVNEPIKRQRERYSNELNEKRLVFKKSYIIKRSPQKTSTTESLSQANTEEILKRVEILKDIQSEIRNIKNDLQKYKEEERTEREKLKKDVEDLKKRIKIMEDKEKKDGI